MFSEISAYEIDKLQQGFEANSSKTWTEGSLVSRCLEIASQVI